MIVVYQGIEIEVESYQYVAFLPTSEDDNRDIEQSDVEIALARGIESFQSRLEKLT